jgi:hypothetical protein
MGAFENMLSEGLPEPEVHIYLPGKVGTVDKGGDAAQAAASPAGKPSDSQASSTAPEPEPQLPEGSDPDDPDELDTAEDDAADAAAAAAAAREMFKLDPAPAPEAETEPEDAGDDDDLDEDPEPESAGTADKATMRPMLPRKGNALNFDGERSQLKHFPKALIELMRDLLIPQLGEPFARELSQNSTVTAFAIAALGVEFEADEKTMLAVDAFRANDPRTLAIETRTADLLEQQTKSAGMLKAILARLGEVTETTAVLEMGQAYALAERTAQLDTSATLPENIDVTQKRVVLARDNIRKKVKTLRQDEKIQAGRPIR